jgi:hypothetical protein
MRVMPVYSQLSVDTLITMPTPKMFHIDIDTGALKTWSTIPEKPVLADRPVLSGDLKDKLSVPSLSVNNKKEIPGKAPKTFLTRSKNFVRKQAEVIQPTGSITIGYEYGVLPFVAGDNYPSGGFQTEGTVSFLLFGLPLEATYHYTTIKNVIGLNNYFRISYDSERYKEQLSKKLDIKNELTNKELDKLQLQQKTLLKKIEYLKYLEHLPEVKVPDAAKPEVPVSVTVDTAFVSSYTGTLANYQDSLMNQKLIDSTYYLKKKDSLTSELNNSRKLYDSLNNEVVLIKKQIEQIRDFQNKPSAYLSPYLSTGQKILSGIKKFEIGLCHPSYSVFLANNLPVQGINIEYAANLKFFAFTYGTTVNNLLFNTNTVQGAIQSGRNLYNYFDFGNLDAGRKILSVKGGIGTKENSHFFAGFLLGKGRADYLTTVTSDSPAEGDRPNESNVVIEADARYKFSEKLSADFVIGKSSTNEEDLTMSSIGRAVDEIFSGYRSYALLSRVNATVSKTKTQLTFTVRWIDPYFKSFGTGFFRSDNLRYELKAEQPLTKKIKYTIAFKREEDNLLRLYTYNNVLQSINNTLTVKLNRQINVRLIYSPLFRELKGEGYSIKDKNDISTVVLSYTPRPKRVNAQFNVLYSKYVISADSGNINFENAAYSHQFLLKSGFVTGMNVSWFKNNLSDSTGNDTYLSVLDIGYQHKKGHAFTIGGKAAYKQGLAPQYGFVLKAKLRVYKKLSWEAEMEKILIGDYYNSFIVSRIKQFPYYCNTKMVLNF